MGVLNLNQVCLCEMGKYTEVKSKFIKEKIKKTSWDDSDDIDILIQIERFVLGERFDLLENYIKKEFEIHYPKEYKAIFKELRPKEWEAMQIDKKKGKERMMRELDEMGEEFVRGEKEKRKDWIKAGGKR